jgi:hypothetical protein
MKNISCDCPFEMVVVSTHKEPGEGEVDVGNDSQVGPEGSPSTVVHCKQ